MRILISALLLLGSLGVSGLTLANDQPSSPNILIIHSYNEFIPWNQAFQKGVNHWLAHDSKGSSIFREYLEAYRFHSLEQDQFAAYLAHKYRDKAIDMIIAESEEASRFMMKYPRLLGKILPVVFFSNEKVQFPFEHLLIKPDVEAVVSESIDLALRLHPKAKKAYIIDGQTPSSEVNSLLDAIREKTNLKAEVIKNFSFDELRMTVSRVPKDSIIFSTLVFEDRNGVKTYPKQVISWMVEHSQAPIFSFYSTLMGEGLVGGHLIDAELLAQTSLQAAYDYHLKGFFPQTQYDSSQNIVDVTALKRYGLNHDRVRSTTKLTNFPISFFDRHQQFFLVLLTLASVLFLASLLWVGYLSKHNRELHRLNDHLNKTKSKLDAANHVLNEMAMVDPLTKLYNRRAMMPILDEVLRRDNRNLSPSCILVCDIDNFKLINDEHGHDIGDEVLIGIGNLIKSRMRESDTLSRWGGEEFLILLPDTDTIGAKAIAEKLRKEIAEVSHSAKLLKVTVSIGVAELEPTMDFKESFRLADDALYQAKRCGKNRVVLKSLECD